VVDDKLLYKELLNSNVYTPTVSVVKVNIPSSIDEALSIILLLYSNSNCVLTGIDENDMLFDELI